MSIALDLHNAHKERLARIDRAAEHRALCAIAAQKVIKNTAIEERAAKVTPESREYKPLRDWFAIDDDQGGTRQLSVGEIQHATCRYFGITKVDLFSRRRHRSVVIPRHIAMYFCKTLTIRSLPEVGRMFGGMDHTSVLNAVRSIEKKMRGDWLIAHDIAHIEELLS